LLAHHTKKNQKKDKDIPRDKKKLGAWRRNTCRRERPKEDKEDDV